MDAFSESLVSPVFKNAVAALCQSVGWNSAHMSTVDVLADLYKKYMIQISKKAHLYAEHFGRSQPNLDDMALTFSDLNISIHELEDYVQHFEPVVLPVAKKIPRFPVPKEDHLNILGPSCDEVLTRPEHVHEYMPPMIMEVKREPKEDKPKTTPIENESTQIDVNNTSEDSNLPDINVKGDDSNHKEDSTDSSTKNDQSDTNTNKKQEDSSITDGSGQVEPADEESSDDDIEELRVSSNTFSPFSKFSESTKRGEHLNENPALKRVRMMLQEEGHPVRTITSVMMTSSGFLTSSAEGRLPASKPPANRDFFEPVTPSVPEKVPKKKITSMKKIVEGVKKVDKERDSDLEELFRNPDKIIVNKPEVKVPAANTNKESSKLKLKKLKREKLKLKTLKTQKLNSKKTKNENMDLDRIKAIASNLKNATKLRKIKSHKESKKSSSRKAVPEVEEEEEGQLEDDAEQEEGEIPAAEGLESIDSDENFSETESKEVPDNLESQLGEPKPGKLSSLKRNADRLPSKIKPLTKKEKRKLDAAKNLILRTESTLVATVKKKRGRPRKIPPIAQPPPTVMRDLIKIKKNHLEPDINTLIPDISLKVKNPAPPFDLLMRLPAQPGLIPKVSPGLGSQSSTLKGIPSSPSLPSGVTITPSVGKASKISKEPTKELIPSVGTSVTITRIDMSHSQKLPTPYDRTITPGIGSPGISHPPAQSISPKISPKKSSSSITQIPIPIAPDSSSGITITPIVLDKSAHDSGNDDHHSPESYQNQDSEFEMMETESDARLDEPKVDKKPSMLAKLEEEILGKEQKRKDKEKRKEMKKKKKSREKIEKKKKKDKKSDKIDKQEKEDTQVSTPSSSGTIPKLTLKLNSNASTPVDSPNAYSSIDYDMPPKKITIKPIEGKNKSPSPELARFSPLVTRPLKQGRAAKIQAVAAVTAAVQEKEVVFPTEIVTGGLSSPASNGKKSRSSKGPKTISKAKPQAALVVETVGSYVDEQGNKVWICPACAGQDDGSLMIGCDECDDWYHVQCLGMGEGETPKGDWFCPKCIKKKKGKSKSSKRKT